MTKRPRDHDVRAGEDVLVPVVLEAVGDVRADRREQQRSAVLRGQLGVGHRVERVGRRRRSARRRPAPRPRSRRSRPRTVRRRTAADRGRAARDRRAGPALRREPRRCPAGGWAGSSRSSAVYTATTPGIERASSRPSTPESRAWGKMERTKTARSAPWICDVLEVPAFAPEEPRVFGAKGRDAEGRGRDGGHGGHGPTAGGKGTMRTIRLLTAATCLVLLPPTVAARAANDGAVAAPAGRAAIKVVPVKTGSQRARPGSRSHRTGRSGTWNEPRARCGSSTRRPARTISSTRSRA